MAWFMLMKMGLFLCFCFHLSKDADKQPEACGGWNVELGSQMEHHLVPTLSEHSAHVFLGICTHKPHALKSGVPYLVALIQ